MPLFLDGHVCYLDDRAHNGATVANSAIPGGFSAADRGTVTTWIGGTEQAAAPSHLDSR